MFSLPLDIHCIFLHEILLDYLLKVYFLFWIRIFEIVPIVIIYYFFFFIHLVIRHGMFFDGSLSLNRREIALLSCNRFFSVCALSSMFLSPEVRVNKLLWAELMRSSLLYVYALTIRNNFPRICLE